MKHTIIQLPDDFEKGDCRNCPFSYLWYLAETDDDVACVFGKSYTQCPIEVRETVKVRDIVDEVFGQMRDATEEEQKSAADFIERLSKPTGINFYDVLDENGKPKHDELVEMCKQIKMECEEV